MLHITESLAREAYRKNIKAGQSFGIPFEILNKDRSSESLPVIDFGAIAGIVYDPSSIRIRACRAIPVLAEETACNEVKFVYDTRVRAFIKEGNRITGVKTNRGKFKAGNVLIAAGVWSLDLLNDMSVNPPVRPLVECRFTRGVIPETPLLIFSDIGFYIREEKGGLLIGGGDHCNQKTG